MLVSWCCRCWLAGVVDVALAGVVDVALAGVVDVG